MKSPSPQALGIVGLGSMGLGAARSALRRGVTTWGCDTRAEVRNLFAKDGGQVVERPADLGPHCRVVVVLVVNAAQTEDVLFGANGLASSMKPGSVIVCSATVDPAVVPGWAERLAAHGLLLIDGPVSGGARKAEAGEMTVMASGEPRAFEAGLELLQACAGKVYRLGDRPGIGSTVAEHTMTEPGFMEEASPFAPNSTSSVCAALTTSTTTTRQCGPRSAGRSTTWPPSFAKALRTSARVSQPQVVMPRRSAERAAPRPMEPRPTMPRAEGEEEVME